MLNLIKVSTLALFLTLWTVENKLTQSTHFFKAFEKANHAIPTTK